ncbi:glycosyltransferase family 4 protein [bacterium]|nr:glycosyltransferase family 4 protein [Akkermansiaceae bacterium]MDB4318223.1 glycosyltransferase family 4 protein [bacterium]MDB4323420.1 glycosyltransferase family 4 protein [Akkermansiaceae bacterium]
MSDREKNQDAASENNLSADQAMRVAHFLPHYPALEGTSSFCRGLTRAINRRAPGSSMIITYKQDVRKHSDEVILSYEANCRGLFGVPGKLAEDLESNTHRLDGVIIHGVYNVVAVGLPRVLEKAGIPYIFVPHDPYTRSLRRHHGLRKWLFWQIFEKHTVSRASAVQLLDAEHEIYLREMGCSSPIEVIPNGCELENLRQIPDTANPPGSQKEIRVQYLGRMDRNHKGLDLLIEGFVLWKKNYGVPDVKLYLTGNDWEDREMLQRLAARLDPTDSIVFTGPRRDTSMTILSEADLVVLTSRFDGFGLCIVEAMLAGRPVMVSSQAGISSHIRKSGSGWIVDPNPESIAEGFARSFSEKELWAEKGALGQEYVKNHLTWDQIAMKTLLVYKKYFEK